MVSDGRWLFRWRGYLPLAALAILLVHLGFDRYRYLGETKVYDDLWQLACALVACLGLAVRAHVIGHAPKDTSGRNAREQRAESLNTTGLYSVVRHPLYVGNFLIFLGAVAFLHDPWAATVCLLGFALYHERIMLAEEAYLGEKFGDEYAEWAARTPAVLPGLHAWIPPTLPFSLRNVLRREYNNFFGVAFTMFILDAASDSMAQHHLTVGHLWVRLVAFGFVFWILLRTMKRKSELLRVPGR